jgi:hypothetical protein
MPLRKHYSSFLFCPALIIEISYIYDEVAHFSLDIIHPFYNFKVLILLIRKVERVLEVAKKGRTVAFYEAGILARRQPEVTYLNALS